MSSHHHHHPTAYAPDIYSVIRKLTHQQPPVRDEEQADEDLPANFYDSHSSYSCDEDEDLDDATACVLPTRSCDLHPEPACLVTVAPTEGPTAPPSSSSTTAEDPNPDIPPPSSPTKKLCGSIDVLTDEYIALYARAKANVYSFQSFLVFMISRVTDHWPSLCSQGWTGEYLYEIFGRSRDLLELAFVRVCTMMLKEFGDEDMRVCWRFVAGFMSYEQFRRFAGTRAARLEDVTRRFQEIIHEMVSPQAEYYWAYGFQLAMGLLCGMGVDIDALRGPDQQFTPPAVSSYDSFSYYIDAFCAYPTFPWLAITADINSEPGAGFDDHANCRKIVQDAMECYKAAKGEEIPILVAKNRPGSPLLRPGCNPHGALRAPRPRWKKSERQRRMAAVVETLENAVEEFDARGTFLRPLLNPETGFQPRRSLPAQPDIPEYIRKMLPDVLEGLKGVGPGETTRDKEE